MDVISNAQFSLEMESNLIICFQDRPLHVTGNLSEGPFLLSQSINISSFICSDITDQFVAAEWI
jgi:hypothetical protein